MVKNIHHPHSATPPHIPTAMPEAASTTPTTELSQVQVTISNTDVTISSPISSIAGPSTQQDSQISSNNAPGDVENNTAASNLSIMSSATPQQTADNPIEQEEENSDNIVVNNAEEITQTAAQEGLLLPEENEQAHKVTPQIPDNNRLKDLLDRIKTFFRKLFQRRKRQNPDVLSKARKYAQQCLKTIKDNDINDLDREQRGKYLSTNFSPIPGVTANDTMVNSFARIALIKIAGSHSRTINTPYFLQAMTQTGPQVVTDLANALHVEKSSLVQTIWDLLEAQVDPSELNYTQLRKLTLQETINKRSRPQVDLSDRLNTVSKKLATPSYKNCNVELLKTVLQLGAVSYYNNERIIPLDLVNAAYELCSPQQFWQHLKDKLHCSDEDLFQVCRILRQRQLTASNAPCCFMDVLSIYNIKLPLPLESDTGKVDPRFMFLYTVVAAVSELPVSSEAVIDISTPGPIMLDCSIGLSAMLEYYAQIFRTDILTLAQIAQELINRNVVPNHHAAAMIQHKIQFRKQAMSNNIQHTIKIDPCQYLYEAYVPHAEMLINIILNSKEYRKGTILLHNINRRSPNFGGLFNELARYYNTSPEALMLALEEFAKQEINIDHTSLKRLIKSTHAYHTKLNTEKIILPTITKLRLNKNDRATDTELLLEIAYDCCRNTIQPDKDMNRALVEANNQTAPHKLEYLMDYIGKKFGVKKDVVRHALVNLQKRHEYKTLYHLKHEISKITREKMLVDDDAEIQDFAI